MPGNGRTEQLAICLEKEIINLEVALIHNNYIVSMGLCVCFNMYTLNNWGEPEQAPQLRVQWVFLMRVSYVIPYLLFTSLVIA